MGKTLLEKIWESHTVGQEGGRTILYIDRHLIHEITSAQAFSGLRGEKRPMRRPDSIMAVIDHNIPTINQSCDECMRGVTRERTHIDDSTVAFVEILCHPVES